MTIVLGSHDYSPKYSHDYSPKYSHDYSPKYSHELQRVASVGSG